jgi:hypothetical protein
VKIRILLFSLAVVGLVSLDSCKETKLLTKDLYITLSTDFIINEPSSTSWDESELLDAAAQSADLDTYKDVIQKVTLDKVTYTVTAFNGPPGQMLNTGFIDVAEESGAGRLTLSQMSNVNIPAALGVESEVPMDATATTKLVDLIKNTPHKAMVYTKGTVSTAPIDMTIKVKLYLTVRVELL